MALTAQTVLDIVDQTQTISFYQSASLVDQVSYASNQITFATISQYTLSKSDYALYFQYLNVFFIALNTNFPTRIISNLWPLCSFNITENNIGVVKLQYTQTSQGNTALTINYVPIAQSAAFSARGSPVTISNQEFAMGMNMLTQYSAQVALN